MKKYLIVGLAALAALVACTKQISGDSRQEIAFRVANFTTKANVAFTGADFAAYSWHHAQDGTVTPMMDNERVGRKGSEWKTLDHTFYWPKSGSLNFISYAPYMADKSKVTVTEEGIRFEAYSVGADDLMYADKAVNQTENITPGTYSEVSGANGVPTLFHHALAKLSFQVQANFLDHTAEDGSKTSWEVTLSEATLGGILNTGTLDLTLASDGTRWETAGWSADRSKTADETALVTGDPVELKTVAQPLFDGNSFFVLPQDLLQGQQTITFSFDIVTHLPNGNKLTETYSQTLDLVALSSIDKWEMNKNIVYTIQIRPTKSFNPGEHPNDPDDAIITFDPAQADWETVRGDVTIQL